MKPGLRAPPETKWRTAEQDRVFCRRLLDALRAAASCGPPTVKEAADSALAITARGESRWSQVVLLGRHHRRKLLRLKANGQIRRGCRRMRPAVAAVGGRKVGDRLRLLRRLVSGCRKLSVRSVLEDAADYVAALEMQVKAMRALADALAAAATSAELERGA
ncbi:transcription factor bHLH147-like [Canna indica]|uniref:Transcription factor bHLH147-like n=1 Tax=Canna indica TaxID=4628 RepID=A0AAQ3QD35_9LILI|nr:transcription factor bHLH147-like [Canna indica]